jgi:hypothetical protein
MPVRLARLSRSIPPCFSAYLKGAHVSLYKDAERDLQVKPPQAFALSGLRRLAPAVHDAAS